MKETYDRGATGQEAPMVISPRRVAWLIRQMVASLRGDARRQRHV